MAGAASSVSTVCTVVIRTHNEAASLKGTVRAVLQQRGTEADVLVIDDGSTDGTVELARQLPVRLAQTTGPYRPGRALNLGVRAAIAPYVVFLSAHSPPVSDTWLMALLAPLEADPGMAGVSGRDVPPADASLADHLHDVLADWLHIGLHEYPKTVSGYVETFSAANGAVRRDVALAVPFCEALVTSEDGAWARSVLRRGWRLGYSAEAGAYHAHHRRFGDLVPLMLWPLRAYAQVAAGECPV